jgi:hypothetical protein
MQMGHRRTHDQVGIGITMVKPVHDLPESTGLPIRTYGMPFAMLCDEYSSTTT